MKKTFYLSLTLFLVFSTNIFAQEKDPSAYTITKVGQIVPEFSFTTLDDKSFNINDFKGETVVLCFFATWCKPCMQELPHVEEEIWKKYKDKNIQVFAIGRKHTKDELITWNSKKKFTFSIVPDENKEIYSIFAEQYIPRTVVINKESKIVFQSVGFEEEDFTKLKKILAKEI